MNKPARQTIVREVIDRRALYRFPTEPFEYNTVQAGWG